MSIASIAVMIVEDEEIWRQAVVEAIVRHPPYKVCATCSDVGSALQSLKTTPFDILIVDLSLPDGSGVEVIRAARRHCPNADILVGTIFADEKSVVAAICAGATGYIVKANSEIKWITAMDDLRAGHSPISPQIARHILRAMQQPSRAKKLASAEPSVSGGGKLADSPNLSAREFEVLKLVAKGFTLGEVGQILHVSAETARCHAKSIYRKLQVNSRGEAVFEATNLGIL